MSDRFGIEGVRVSIAVEGADPALRSWLQDMLRPYFSVSSVPAREAITVELVSKLPAALSVMRLDWSVPREFEVAAESTQARIIVRAHPELGDHRIALFQLIRGLLVGLLLPEGVPIHGAALRCNGMGVLLVGPKGAGKTSFATSLLRNCEGSAMITNDKAVLVDNVLVGLPYAVLVGGEGLARTPELHSIDGRVIGAKRAFWPREYACALGRDLTASTSIDLVVLCGADFSRPAISARGLRDAEVSDARSCMRDIGSALIPRAALAPRGHRPVGSPAKELIGLTDARWVGLEGNPWALGKETMRSLFDE